MLNELILHLAPLEEDPVQGVDDIEGFFLYHGEDLLLLCVDHAVELFGISGHVLADLADDRVPQLLFIQPQVFEHEAVLEDSYWGINSPEAEVQRKLVEVLKDQSLPVKLDLLVMAFHEGLQFL